MTRGYCGTAATSLRPQLRPRFSAADWGTVKGRVQKLELIKKDPVSSFFISGTGITKKKEAVYRT